MLRKIFTIVCIFIYTQLFSQKPPMNYFTGACYPHLAPKKVHCFQIKIDTIYYAWVERRSGHGTTRHPYRHYSVWRKIIETKQSYAVWETFYHTFVNNKGKWEEPYVGQKFYFCLCEKNVWHLQSYTK